jgi:uncharacterized protein (UPF0332 family)
VRIEVARLARREPSIDRELTRFLATAYQLKATADYGIGPTAAPITADEAAPAIATASRFTTSLPSAAARLTPPRHFRPSPPKRPAFSLLVEQPK